MAYDVSATAQTERFYTGGNSGPIQVAARRLHRCSHRHDLDRRLLQSQVVLNYSQIHAQRGCTITLALVKSLALHPRTACRCCIFPRESRTV